MIPDCDHKVKMECRLEPDRKYCYKKCPRILPCGHKCTKTCDKPCTEVNCSAMVDCLISSSLCGHTIKRIQCHLKNTGK